MARIDVADPAAVGERHDAYRADCARQMAAAYPPNERGETVFPFTRLFILARPS